MEYQHMTPAPVWDWDRTGRGLGGDRNALDLVVTGIGPGRDWDRTGIGPCWKRDRTRLGLA